MRLFLAVFPPPAVREAVAEVVDGWRRPGEAVSWVRRDNLHYTLRFLGELGEDGARRAAEAARAAAAGHPAFAAATGAFGAFPRAEQARVLWLGLSAGRGAMEALAGAVEEELRRRGFGAADKRFSAHLTVGRVRHGATDWSGRLAGADLAQRGFAVDRIQVVASTLSPGGSIYRVREEALLPPAAG